MAILCPKGHESDEADFCSECGAKIPGTAVCPDCGAQHPASEINYCEVCGYNFLTGGHGEIPQVATLPIIGWKLLISVDPSLQEPNSPPPPANGAPVEIAIVKPVNVVGRSSASRAIHPEIPLDLDDAVSHRHALINLDPAGALILRDIGSTNGTRLNGRDLTPLSDVSLHDGDQITLGHWTRIVIKAVR